jgi:hypothetical protein
VALVDERVEADLVELGEVAHLFQYVLVLRFAAFKDFSVLVYCVLRSGMGWFWRY